MRFIQHITYKGLVPPTAFRKASNVRQKTVVYDIVAIDAIRGIPKSMMDNPYPLSLTLAFGMAVVHPTDEYSKKRGIVEATSKLKDETFEISRATVHNSSKGRVLHIVASKEFVIGKHIKEFVTLHIHYNLDTKIIHSSVHA